jgi:enoyl-CoA hydratase
MSYQTLAIEPRDQVLLVTLNRPKALNALNTQMGRELCDLWTRLAAEPGATRCVVLTGAGERAFCAGADLKERDGMAQADWQAQHELFERGFMALMEFPLPVIAALNGHAFGGGREIALCCDFIYASNVARCALPEVHLGQREGMDYFALLGGLHPRHLVSRGATGHLQPKRVTHWPQDTTSAKP